MVTYAQAKKEAEARHQRNIERILKLDPSYSSVIKQEEDTKKIKSGGKTVTVTRTPESKSAGTEIKTTGNTVAVEKGASEAIQNRLKSLQKEGYSYEGAQVQLAIEQGKLKPGSSINVRTQRGAEYSFNYNELDDYQKNPAFNREREAALTQQQRQRVSKVSGVGVGISKPGFDVDTYFQGKTGVPFSVTNIKPSSYYESPLVYSEYEKKSAFQKFKEGANPFYNPRPDITIGEQIKQGGSFGAGRLALVTGGIIGGSAVASNIPKTAAFALNVGKGVVGYQVGSQGVKFVTSALYSPEVKSFSKNQALTRTAQETALTKTKSKYVKSASSIPVIGSIAAPIIKTTTDVLPNAFFAVGSKEYKAQLYTFYRQKGLSGREKDVAVQSTRAETARRTGSRIAGLLGLGASTELIGRTVLAGSSFTTTPTVTGFFKSSAIAGAKIAPVGAIEGGVDTYFGQKEQYGKVSASDVYSGAVSGAVSAAVLGGPIVAASPYASASFRKVISEKGYKTSAYRKIGGAFETAGNLLDLSESPGDFIADVYSKGKKSVGFKSRVPVVSFTPSNEFFFSGTSVSGKGKSVSSVSSLASSLSLSTTQKSRAKALSKVFGVPVSSVEVQSRLNQPSFVPTSTFVNVNAKTSVSSKTSTSTSSSSDTFVQTSSFSDVFVSSKSNVPVSVSSNVPVTVPDYKGGFFIPPFSFKTGKGIGGSDFGFKTKSSGKRGYGYLPTLYGATFGGKRSKRTSDFTGLSVRF